mmetsp:Transcript_35614/g.34650  ORF Transcript_35614/g.34650 Transcript_35614/m.34650 type:complete len:83 (+) Transcript_35614:331-579(+)
MAITCEKSFGNPSGHSCFAFSISTTIFLMFFHDDTVFSSKKLDVEWWSKKDWAVYFLTLTLMTLFAALVCFSRVPLGVHSYD